MKERTRQFLMRNYWSNVNDSTDMDHLFSDMIVGLVRRAEVTNFSLEVFLSAEKTAKCFMRERGFSNFGMGWCRKAEDKQ